MSPANPSPAATEISRVSRGWPAGGFRPPEIDQTPRLLRIRIVNQRHSLRRIQPRTDGRTRYSSRLLLLLLLLELLLLLLQLLQEFFWSLGGGLAIRQRRRRLGGLIVGLVR